MGIKPWYDVWCDDEGCLLWTHGGSTRAEAAKAARREGWRKTRDGWKCPSHQGKSGQNEEKSAKGKTGQNEDRF